MALYQGTGFLTNTFKATKEARWFSFKERTPLYSWDSRQISPGMSLNTVLNILMIFSFLFAKVGCRVPAFLNVAVKAHTVISLLCKAQWCAV